MSEEKPVGGIPLTEVVQQLRQEILRAVDAASASETDLKFRLDKVQLELEVAVTRGAEGTSKAKFWVLEFEAKGSVEKSRTQKVILELTPEANGSAGAKASGFHLGRDLADERS